MYASGPFLGRLTDSTGSRPALTLAFVLLLSGYLGLKAIYDASEYNMGPVGDGTLFALVLFELLSGIGGGAGYSAALNTIVRSFPDRVVSSDPGSITSATLTLLFDLDVDRSRTHHLRLRTVRFPFFHDRTHVLSRRHFRFSARSSGRDSRPNGAWLVLHSPLSVPRTHSRNGPREQWSRGIR